MNNKIFKEKKNWKKDLHRSEKESILFICTPTFMLRKKAQWKWKGQSGPFEIWITAKKRKECWFFLNGKMVFTHIQYKSKRTFYLHVCLRLILSFCDILTRVEWDIICFKWKREYRHERQVTRLSQTTKR